MMKKLSKRAMSVLLAIGVLLSANIVGVSALDVKKDTEAVKTEVYADSNSNSEYVEPEYERADYMTDQQYQNLGFSSLEDPALFDENDTSNPLEGYEVSILSELYMGQGGYGKDYTADARIMENAKNYGDLDIDSLKKNTLASNSSYINDANNGKNWQYQSSVTAAVKLGDLSSDEFIPDSVIQNSMYVQGNDSCQSLVLYKYNEKEHSLDYESQNDWSLQINNKFVQDIEVQESGGYQAITVGDFDGDNYNEVAVYRSSLDSPVIAIYKQSVENGKVNLVRDSNMDIKLSDISTHFANTKDTNRPLVNLSTTDIAGRDDLVICVTLPYSNDNTFCHGGCTAIYSCKGKAPQRVYKDYMEYDNYRMKFTASETMDINGDGSKELVIASNKNTNYKDGSSRGDMSKDKNLVNVVLWSESDNKYFNAWSEPQQVEALDFIKKDKDRKEPVAITGTRFSSTSQKETLFVEGVFYNFAQGTGETADEQIINGKFVTSSKFNSSTGNNNSFIHLAQSASFVEEDRLLEQTLVLYGDECSTDHDKIYLDIYWCYSNGSDIKIQCVNDNYFNHKNEDDNGTFLTFCPLDVDMDTVYMKYENKTVGWSNPTVHSVMLSAPYWSELDYGTAMTARGSTTYKIETGTTDTFNFDMNLGLGISIVFDTKFSTFGNGGKLGFSVDAAGNYIYKYQSAHTKKETLTFTSGAGEDYVALIVVPIVTYHYKTWVPEHAVTQEDVDKYIAVNGEDGCPKVGDIIEGQYTDMAVNVQLNPANSTVPISTYNRVIEEFNRTENEEFHLPTVDVDSLYAGRIAGDPSTYASNVSEISSADADDKNTLVAENWASVGVNKKSTTSLDLGEGESTSNTHGFGFSLKAGISETLQWGIDVMSIFVAQQTLKITESFQGSWNFTWASSNSTNNTYSTTFASLPESAQTGTSSAGTPISSYAFNAAIVKWSPKNLSSDVIETIDGENLVSDASVIGCIVQGADGAPPSLPSDFHVSSTTKNTATLRWNNSSNYDRKPYSYMLYYSKSATGDYFPFTDSAGNNVVISGDKEVCTVQGLAENNTYYFKLKAFYDPNDNNSASVLGPYTSGTTKDNSAEPSITKPPVDLYKGIGDKPIFTIEATPSNPENTLTYKWQQLVQSDYLSEWKDISGSEASSSSFNAAYYAENGVINSANAKSLNKTAYRCIVTEHEKNGYNYCSVISRAAVLYTTSEHEHFYNSNGFCIYCESYQPATLNSDGVYEISNAGQLYWFASLVNGDRTHADFESQNGAANAILVKDIVVNDGDISKLASAQSNSLRKWSPIGTSDNSYTGQFDGRNHTISGIYFSDPTADNVGLFGYTRGGADIYNVGIVNSYIEGKNCVGGILGRNNNSGVNIQHCFSEATVIGNEGVGGIEGSTYGGKIINCYNAGSVTGSKFVGSIRGRNTNSSGAMNNCFNVGEVIGTGTDNIGGIRGDGNGTISNCYCISNQLTDAAATTKTPEQFASGEVAYLLNNSVTDGKQVWYQNIDNDKTPDDYPRFDGGTVYYLEYKDAYSNTYSEKPAEPDAFDKDDDGNLIISTYGDLVKLSELIRSDYEVYGSQNYILTNNIKASDDSEWSQGIGSVEDNKPFNGTFNGKGYCIVGLNVNSPKYGGLFEIIGENGKVKDLFVYDCDFKSSSGTSGGIAAINNGTIDHCISGINLTSGIIHINSDITIDAVALNSSVKGELSGGIAGENNGLITGSRNAAVVTGAQCGGIAAENNGKIYGCANSVKIGASSSSVSGGLVGRNGGIIESSYNSGTVSGNSEKTTGSIAGINGYDGAENPTVKNVFYTTVNNLNAVGTDSLTKPDETNKVKSKNSDFQSDDFVNELNSVSDDTVTWVRKSKFNKGNPTIKGNFFMYNVISAENGINIEGSMHEALNIQYNVCTEKDEEYKAITSALDKTSVSDVYSVSLTDNDGNYIPAELWCQGDYKISVPVSGNNVEFAAIDTDGQINYYKPDSVENGIAVFTVSHPMSFAVVDRTSTNKNISDIKSTDKAVINTSNDNTTIQTGSTVCCSVLLIVMFASAFVIIFKRRNNFE